VTSPGPLGRRQDANRIPRGDVVGEYESYAEAQRTVDRLAKADDFPVARVSILGNDLKMVERVTRRLSWGRAALEGVLSGAWFGLFVALLLSFLQPVINWTLFISAILIGAGFGMLFRFASYAGARRSRDFASTSQVIASSYQVVVEPGLAEQARAVLARPVE